MSRSHGMENYQKPPHILRLEERIAKKLRTKEEGIARRDREIMEKTEIITAREKVIAEKDVEISNLKAQLDASNLLARNKKMKFFRLQRSIRRNLAKAHKRIRNLQQGQKRSDQLLVSKRNASKFLRNENSILRLKWLRCKSALEGLKKKKKISELNLKRMEMAIDNAFPDSSCDENDPNDCVHSDSDDSLRGTEVEEAPSVPSEIVEVQMGTGQSQNEVATVTFNNHPVSRREPEVDGPINPVATFLNSAPFLQRLSIANVFNTMTAAAPTPAQQGSSSSAASPPSLQFFEAHGKDSSRTVVGRYYCKCKNKEFKCEHYLNRHISRQKHRNFSCPHCDHRFHSLFEFKKHLLNAYGKPLDDGTATGCSPCGREFESRSEYAKHFWELHKDLHRTTSGSISASEADQFYRRYEASFRSVNDSGNEEISQCDSDNNQ
ncbi:unnamed protein product [Orchesella dallaii]|uniref:C2H2-type domain-containing protein n=1 Tax=Orchesella dallaii TaxID=48710 RepID=A0ABP1Q7H9_9HEXA